MSWAYRMLAFLERGQAHPSVLARDALRSPSQQFPEVEKKARNAHIFELSWDQNQEVFPCCPHLSRRLGWALRPGTPGRLHQSPQGCLAECGVS